MDKNIKRPIKVGFLVSYDYELLKNSLPTVYEHADRIVLAVDKDGKTWSGNTLQIDKSFWQWLEEFDCKHKIEIYRDSFFVEGLSAVQNETRERNMLGRYMGEGGWHIQVDADEYFADFKHFVDFLHELDRTKSRVDQVYMEWLVLYKRLPNGYLMVKDGGGTALATTRPEYACCRIITRPKKKTVYPQRVIHDSWARSEEELYTKLKNWGHNNDFDTDGYFAFWKAINEQNWRFFRNFHPYEPETYKKLDYMETENLQGLLQYLKKNRDLLSVPKKESRWHKILRLCVPPIYAEARTYFQIKKHTNIVIKNIAQK